MRYTEILHIRLLPVERQALEALADGESRSPSEMMRELIRRAATERGYWQSLNGGDGNGRPHGQPA